jgi:plasmid stabilization system protein ParE
MPGRRELIFPGLPYVVVYRVTEQAVEISRIFHGAQDWPYAPTPTAAARTSRRIAHHGE